MVRCTTSLRGSRHDASNLGEEVFSSLLFSVLMLVGIVSLRAQPPCDVYLNDPAISECYIPGLWQWKVVHYIQIALPPNGDICTVQVWCDEREFYDTCTGQNMHEHRIAYWSVDDCPAYKEYADNLRQSNPDYYRTVIRMFHLNLIRKLTETLFTEKYSVSQEPWTFHCIEAPPSCARLVSEHHYVTSVPSKCVEYLEVRTLFPMVESHWCWFYVVAECTVSECCFLHREYCWDTATNSPRVCEWWTVSGESLHCNEQYSNYDPQQAFPECTPSPVILWRSGCRIFDCSQ